MFFFEERPPLDGVVFVHAGNSQRKTNFQKKRECPFTFPT